MEGGQRFNVPLAFRGARVTRVGARFITVNLDPERRHFSVRHSEGLDISSPKFRELGGMSGGPAFVDRRNAIRPDLVAIVSEHHAEINQTVMSRLDAIRNDGSIMRGTLG